MKFNLLPYIGKNYFYCRHVNLTFWVLSFVGNFEKGNETLEGLVVLLGAGRGSLLSS